MRVVVGYVDVTPPHRFTRQEGFPFWTMGIGLVGGGHIWQGDGVIRTAPGSISVTEPRVPYRLAMTDGDRYQEYFAILAMPEDWVMWKTWPERLPGMRSLPVKDSQIWSQIVQAFAQALESLKIAGAAGEDLALNLLERALLLGNSVNPLREARRIDERVELAIAYAREHLNQRLEVADLAEAAQVSPSRLAHLFTEKLGESPMRHVEGLRMRRAQELLLSTGLPIREVARRVGFENPYHFSDRFRRVVGQSPRGFRIKPP